MTPKTRLELFDYMDQEHNVSLLETGMEEIENIILKEYKEELVNEIITHSFEKNVLDGIIELIQSDGSINHKDCKTNRQ